MKTKGILIVVSGFAGSGKGTLMNELLKQFDNYALSISATTRKPRGQEVNGREYFFKTTEEFEKMIAQDELIEYANYVGNYYGTPIDYVQKTMADGRDVFLEIEVQGALQVKKQVPEGIFIFLSPPNLQELKARIIGRGTDELNVIEERMEKAVEELKMIRHYDYVVENDTVENAARKIRNIIESEHLKVSRQIEDYSTKIKEME